MVILLLPVPLVLLDTQMGLGVDEINGGFKGPVIVVGCIGFLNLPVLERYIPHQLEDTADFENRHYKLTDAQIAGLEELLQSEPLPNNHIMWEDQYWGITLYKSSEDLLLKKEYMDIYSTGYGYFLLLRPENGSEELRSVPQEYTSLIQDISRAFLINDLKFG